MPMLCEPPQYLYEGEVYRIPHAPEEMCALVYGPCQTPEACAELLAATNARPPHGSVYIVAVGVERTTTR